MRLRPFRESDIERIDEIWRKHHANDFSVPNRKCSIIDAVIEDDDGNIVAYGQVKMFAEAVLILDKDARPRHKVEALKLLIVEGIRGTERVGLEDMYLFARDPSFASVVAKHFSFEIVDEPGELLLRKV
jgi:hypothetical protein